MRANDKQIFFAEAATRFLFHARAAYNAHSRGIMSKCGLAGALLAGRSQRPEVLIRQSRELLAQG